MELILETSEYVDQCCSFYCLGLNNESRWLFAKCERGRWACNADTSTTVLRRGWSFVSPFPTSRTLTDVIYQHQPTINVLRDLLYTHLHRYIVTCTEYAYRKPGSATFRHLRINVVISSALGNSLLAASYALFELTVPPEALSACCACQSKPIYEYFSAENTRYIFHRANPNCLAGYVLSASSSVLSFR